METCVPSNYEGAGREGFMKYAAEMGPGVMIYILSFINLGSSIQKLTEEARQRYRLTDRMEIALTYLYVSKTRKVN
jgi:hypothetical protein